MRTLLLLVGCVLLLVASLAAQTFSNIDDTLTGWQNPPCSNLNPVGSFCAGGTGNPVSDGTVNTTTTAAITATGSQSVAVASTAGMVVGQAFLIGGATSESVAVTGTSAGHFQATFSKTHINGVTVQCCFSIQTISHATPSLDGASMEIGFTGPVLSSGQTTNILWPHKVGANSAITTLSGTWNLNFPNAGLIQAKELDIFQFVLGQRYMYGTECDNPTFTSGKLRIWNQCANSNGGAWVTTSVACPLFSSSNVWHSFTMNTHRVPGDTSCTGGNPCMYYDSIIIDGTTYTGFTPQCSAPNGEPDNIGTQTQIDEAATGGLVTEFEDEMTLVLSTPPSDIYFAFTSAGANTGANCPNARAVSTHAVGDDIAGNTLHLCGAFPMAANTTVLTLQASGSSGLPITVKFETGASLTSPYFPSATGAINSNGKSYITIDGGTNGIIQNTLNGTHLGACPGGTCTTQNNTTGIMAYNCPNCEIKNVSFLDLYDHTSSADVTPDAQQINAIQFYGSNILIHDNTMRDLGWALYQNYHTDSGVQIYNNNISNMAHGLYCAGAAFTQSNLTVANNTFGSMANWGTGGADAYHLTGIHCANGSGGKIQNVYIYNNLFNGNMGTCCWTGFIFLEGTSSGTPWTDSTGTAYLWNNIFVANLDIPNGLTYIGSGTGHQLYNNTWMGPLAGVVNGTCAKFDTSAANIVFENNVAQGCTQLIDGTSTTTFATIDYNTYGDSSGGNPTWQFGALSATSLAAWKSACSCDAHSIASLGGTLTGLSTSTGVISAGFAGITAGLNLSGLATGNLASLASDTGAGDSHIPVVRTSPWDIGAYAFTISSYSLTVTPTIGGSVADSQGGIVSCTSLGGTCSTSYAPGTVDVLTATPTSGYTFAGWSGACSGTSACSLTMSSNLAATATFTPPATGITPQFQILIQ